jgi:hypothetical protein
MSWSGSVAVVLAIVAGVVAWASIAIIIPWSEAERFRCQLWRLRDQVTDDMLADNLPRQEALQLRNQIDMFLSIVHQATVANMLLVRLLLMKRLPQGSLSTQNLESRQGELLEDYRRSLYRSANRHLLVRSVSGWLTALVFWTVIIPYRRIRSRALETTPPRTATDLLAETDLLDDVMSFDAAAFSRQ